ncbi:hypothetical protein EE612_041616 [Oryza sativa]|nr:hypothetical protein EE612_041616 [Oryza sativa]
MESPARSCVSSEAEDQQAAAAAMVVAGCPRCLMYVMLAVSNTKQPRCPRCNTPVLLHFHNISSAPNKS